MEGVNGDLPSAKDTQIPVTVTLEDLYNGKVVEESHRRRVICRICRFDPSHPKCKGCGKCPPEIKLVQRQLGPGMIVQQQMEVPSSEKCKQETTVLKIEIERGMAEGDSITFPHMGDQRPQVLPGDVLAVLQVRSHRKFRRGSPRRGESPNDLYMTLKISLREGLLGFKRTIKHLDGRDVEVEHADPVSPGETFKVNNEGMPHKGDATQFGDLFLEVEIQMPGKLSVAQRNLLDEAFPAHSNTGNTEL